jgi:hypothetical protein
VLEIGNASKRWQARRYESWVTMSAESALSGSQELIRSTDTPSLDSVFHTFKLVIRANDVSIEPSHYDHLAFRRICIEL